MKGRHINPDVFPDPSTAPFLVAILSQRLVNHQVLAEGLYPNVKPASAAAKFNNRLSGARPTPFTAEEQQQLGQLALTHLAPLAEAHAGLLAYVPLSHG